MSDLIDFVLDAHGGTARWERATQLSATMRVYGDFWAFKGQPDLLSIETVDADIHQQRIRMTPFGDGHSVEFDSTSDQVTITDESGTVVDQLVHPRTSMAGYTGSTQWTATNRLLHLLCHLDLPARTLPLHPPRHRDPRDRAVARSRRNVAAPRSDLPEDHRQPQHGSDLLLRRRH